MTLAKETNYDSALLDSENWWVESLQEKWKSQTLNWYWNEHIERVYHSVSQQKHNWLNWHEVSNNSEINIFKFIFADDCNGNYHRSWDYISLQNQTLYLTTCQVVHMQSIIKRTLDSNYSIELSNSNTIQNINPKCI